MEPSNNDDYRLNRLHDSLRRLENLDLRDVLDQQGELKYRLDLVRTFHGLFQHRRNPRDLFAAIDHAEVIIRRLPAAPVDKIEMLNTLSWMKMSAFFLSRESQGESLKLADAAIEYARAAIAEIAQSGIDSRDEMRMAYDNLGQALVAKAQIVKDVESIDEAIVCGRHTVRLSDTEEQKSANSVNVAIRLHLRYRKTRQEADVSEALEILTRNIETLPPGSTGYGGSVIAKGEIFSEMYKRSGDLDMLDKAIANYTQGADSTTPTHDRFFDTFDFLGDLYEQRSEKTSDVSELRKALACYARAVAGAPSHPRTFNLISRQIHLLRKVANTQEQLPEIEQTLRQARSLWARTSPEHKEYLIGANVTGRIFARLYLLTRKLNQLKALVAYALDVGEKHNKSSQALLSRGRMDLKPVQNLQACLNKLAERQVEGDVLDKIFEYFSTAEKSAGPLNGIVVMYKDHGPELENLCGLSDANKQTDDSSITHRRNPFLNPEDPYRDPITGMRYLAMAPGSDTMIMTMEPIVRNIMGYDKDHPDPRSPAEHAAREARLEAETFERETREGKNPNPGLCRVCRKVELLIRNETDGTLKWNDKSVFLPYGNWNQLKCRRHCAVCHLVLSLVAEDPNNPVKLHPRLAKIDHEVQGTQFEILELDSGEQMLGVKFGLLPVGGLRIVSEGNRREALRDGEALGGLQGRISPEKVQTWLKDCEGNHGKRCGNYFSSKRCHEPIPLMFIDVVNQCLVRATSAEKYFALSYVWGGPQTMSTAKSNVESRFQSGSLAENKCRLPQTIRDAMAWVSLLGKRYLWVDSMCIVQNDVEAKDRDIQRMDAVYMMAFATIAAVHGGNADAGLPGLRPGSRPAQRTASLSFPSLSSPDGGQVTLAATPGPLLLALETSVWETRGWVLQEHLLSRRCLFFTSNWVYFQCGQDIISETAMDGYSTLPYAPRTKRARLQENPLTILTAKTGLVTEQQRLQRTFEAYAKLVDIYVCCDLTDYDDIVNAFTGILGVLEEHFSGGFTSALPTSALDLALLWAPGQKMLNRTSYIRDPKDPDHWKKPYFPSWSWAGWVPWVGRPGYRLFDSLFITDSPRLQSKPPQPLPTPLIDVFTLHHHGVFQTIHSRGTPSSSLSHSIKRTNISGPDFGPSVLQFWAETADPSNFPFITDPSGWVMPEPLSLRENVHTQTTQSVIRLQDSQGRHCGLWYDNKNHRLWYGTKDPVRKKEQPKMEMLAVSRTVAAPGERIQGPFRVEGEIEMFDRGYFEDEGPNGGVVNCLVVEWYEEVAARVTVAQVHWRAWNWEGVRRGVRHVRLI